MAGLRNGERNESSGPTEMLVVSSPNSYGDRVEAPTLQGAWADYGGVRAGAFRIRSICKHHRLQTLVIMVKYGYG